MPTNQMPSTRGEEIRNKILVTFLTLSLIITCTGVVAGQEGEPDQEEISCVQDGRTCATDPTYQFFEKEQLRAYCRTQAGRSLLRDLLQNVKAIREAAESTDKALRERPNSMNLDPSIIEEDSRKITDAVFKQKLPTCYENPLIYYMISQYVKEVERARKQLRLPLRILPKYGSLPTQEINAYTYPAVTDKEAVDKRGSVIGFNVQLFMFAYQMTKVTMPTVEVSQDVASKKVQVDFSRETAIRAIESNNDLRINFATALLEFLLLAPPSTQPLDSKYDAPLITFTQAIELFAVAHEYGHLIKGHAIDETRRLQFDSGRGQGSQPTGTVVGVRSWQQELEADTVGIQLLLQVLKNRVSDSKDTLSRRAAQLRLIYALYGALFYFKCSDIIDKARYIKEHGTPPPPLSVEERGYVRALADGRMTTEQGSKYPDVSLKKHPPAWLRLERAKSIIDQQLRRGVFTQESKEYAQVAVGLIQNVDVLWEMTLPRLPTIIKAFQNEGALPEITYVQSPTLWMRTFLYNPALQKAISVFRDANTSDTEAIKQYAEAVKTDWLLLSGLQVQWAEEAATSGDPKRLGEALSVIALSGDRRSISVLKQLNVSTWRDEDRALLARVLQFLERNGRDTSISTLEATPAPAFKLSNLLSFPAHMEEIVQIESLVPDQIKSDAGIFLRNNRAVAPERSLSSMALYMLAAKTDPSTSYGFWSDALLKANKADAALGYAQEGIAKAGPTASLENNIGNILSAKGDLRGAITHYESSLKLGRVDGWPEINMANNYAELGELDQAEQWFRRALTRRDTARSVNEYAGYLNDFAWFLATRFKTDKKRVEEALALSLVSNKLLNYSYPNYLDTLAECFAANGDIELAVKTQRAALDLLPDDSPKRDQYKKRLSEFESKLKK